MARSKLMERPLPESAAKPYWEARNSLPPEYQDSLDCGMLLADANAAKVAYRMADEMAAEMKRNYGRRFVRGLMGLTGPRADNMIYVWQVGEVS